MALGERGMLVRWRADTTDLVAGNAAAKASVGGVAGTAGLASGKMMSLGAKMSAAGASATRLTLPLAAAGYAMVKSAIDFEDSMNKVERLANTDHSQVLAWGKQILEMAPGLAQGPNELAEALYYVASSGAPASVALDIVKTSAKAATIGMGEAQVIADALTSTINVYGEKNITAARAGDILTAAVRAGKGEAEDYATTIGRTTPLAHELGIGFEQVAGAMSVVTNRGLSAAEAATGIRQAMVAVIKPTKAANGILAEHGLTMEDIRKTMKEKGYLAGLQQMMDLTNGNKEEMGKLFPNIRGLNAALILTNKEGLSETNNIMAEVANSSGVMDDAFNKATDTTEFRLKKSLATLQTTGVELGTSMLPTINSILEWVSGMATAIGNLNPNVLDMAIKFGVAAVALGPVLMIGGNILKLFGFLASPAGILILLIVGLAVAAIELYKHWEPFRNIVNEVFDRFTSGIDVLEERWPGFVDNLQTGATEITDAWTEQSANFSSGIDDITNQWNNPGALQVSDNKFVRAIGYVIDIVHNLVTIAVALFHDLVGLFQWIGETIGHFFMTLWNRIKTPFLSVFTEIWSGIVEIFSGVWGVINGLWNIIAGAFSLDWSRMWGGLKDVFGGIWDIIVGIVRFALNLITNILGVALGLISYIWGYAWGLIKTIFVGAWDVISAVAGKIYDWVIHPIWSIMVWLKDQIVWIWTSIVDFFGGLPSKIGNAVSGMWNGILDGFKGVMNWIIDKWNNFGFQFPTIDVPFIGKIGGWTFDTPNIPRFHTGGVVPGRPGQEVPILAQAGETIRSRRQEMALRGGGSSGGGGSTTNNYYISALDPREAMREASRQAAWDTKTTGR